MRVTRRKLIGSAAAIGAVGSLGICGRVAIAQAKRILKFNIVANTLGIHIPYMGALNEILPDLGYSQPQIDRISRLETITQTVLSGSAEIGSGAPKRNRRRQFDRGLHECNVGETAGNAMNRY